MHTYRIYMRSPGLADYSILVGAKRPANARRNMERRIADIAHHGHTFTILRIKKIPRTQ